VVGKIIEWLDNMHMHFVATKIKKKKKIQQLVDMSRALGPDFRTFQTENK